MNKSNINRIIKLCEELGFKYKIINEFRNTIYLKVYGNSTKSERTIRIKDENRHILVKTGPNTMEFSILIKFYNKRDVQDADFFVDNNSQDGPDMTELVEFLEKRSLTLL